MAARFCPQCGQETSSAAQFCARCGAALTPGPVVAAKVNTSARLDTAARNTRRLLAPLVIAALVVLAVAVGVLANRLHEESLLASRPVPPPAAPPLTNAPTSAPLAPPLTNAPTQPLPAAAPLTNAPTTGPGQLPPDVAAYVAFLKTIEDRRLALEDAADTEINAALTQDVTAQNAQSTQALQNAENDVNDEGNPTQNQQNQQSPTPSSSQANQSLNNYEVKWQDLIGSFRSKAAPEQCTLLANDYLLFLTDDFTGVSQLHVGILGLTSGNKSALSSELLKTQTKRDQEGTAADAALGDLCARYNAPKPFSIQPEGSSSSLLGQ